MRLRFAALAFILIAGAAAVSAQQSTTAATIKDKIAILKQARDNGLITEQEYETKLRALQAGATGSGTGSGAAAPVAGSAAGKGGGLVVTSTRPVQVIDPAYGMAAVQMNIPSDWKFVGMVVRPSGCHSANYSLDYTAESADGRYAFSLMPQVVWMWTTSEQNSGRLATQACAPINVKTAGDFLVNIAVPHMHPHATIVSVDALLPEAMENIKARNEKARQQAGNGPVTIGDGARVRIRYESGGQTFEELMIVAIGCLQSQQRGANGQVVSQGNCTTYGTTIFRAPSGQLDSEIATLTPYLKDVHPNNDWFMRTLNDQTKRNQAFIQASDAAFKRNLAENQAAYDARFKAIEGENAARAESTQRSMARAQDTQNAIDHAAHNEENYSLDQRDFVNKSTGQTVTASSEYNHQWMSSDGSTVIQTNDHSYDPNGSVYPNQSWTELVPKN